LLDRFVQHLDQCVILTFNWDTLLEKAFERNNIKYSYDLDQGIKHRCNVILKLHGSIDWFKPREFNYQALGKRFFQNLSPQLRKYKRYIGNLDDCYNNHMTPFIVTPNFDKITQLNAFKKLWIMPWNILQNKLNVNIIGFSMRDDDYHTRAFIYPQLYIGSSRGDMNIKVIDYAADDKDKVKLKKKYSGISDVRFDFKGFNKATMAWLREE